MWYSCKENVYRYKGIFLAKYTVPDSDMLRTRQALLHMQSTEAMVPYIGKRQHGSLELTLDPVDGCYISRSLQLGLAELAVSSVGYVWSG
jgi:hypothetical protein